MNNDKADKVINFLFKSIHSRYQNNFQKVDENELVCLQLCSFIVLYMSYIYSIVYVVLYLNEGGSYTDSPDWMKNKKATLMLSIKNIINSLNTL